MDELIIDWAESAKIAGNNLEAAKEFIHLLVDHLKKEKPHIQQTFDQHNFSELKKQLHSLRGALCYCSVPKLKSALIRLENAVKLHTPDITLLFSQFTSEIKNLIEKIKE
ncbi:MAG TPA: Hpt domain-containing protein [Gammaproteobacteria bacterium]|jgi:HPt (histidine-containing phosphotransfer) domain-containing protein|nr:Hpt domain-containing protein [Gammaproteobacteria bacterium]